MKNFWLALFKPRAWIAKLLLIITLAALLLLSFFDYLNPIKEFLNSNALSFNVGKFHLSAYLLIKVFLTIIVLFWLVGIFSGVAEKKIKAIKGVKESNKVLIIKSFQIIVYFIAFIVGLDILGIDLTTLTVLGGAIGIGVGFGLQKIASNFISGLILIFEKSIENDDLVELSDGINGFVRHIGARYALIETFDGKEIMVPNEDFMTNRVINWTFSNAKGRIEIKVGVSYESDIEKTRKLILEAANEHPRCIEDPAPVCHLMEFADSSVNFLLFFWVEDVTKGRVETRSDVMRAIWKKFKENNIVIPYPQRDLHIKNAAELK